eukprot:TRINITY_DN8665_c0_g1_i1.p1 TRINITY_DN8665_c0_g1~~TRINITY_DN8665_c0_g1_i1.p1  ORF type:complete len:249 (+),score=64.13 TRINITY_DN8665_c0_g1_i1:242-988(+)
MAATTPYPQLLLVGDSLTAGGFKLYSSPGNGTGPGWALALQDDYCQALDVINRGANGHSCRTWEPFWEQSVLRTMDRAATPVVTLALGANDCAVQAPQHVPVPEFKRRMTGYAKSILAHPQWASGVVELAGGPVPCALILITPPSLDDALVAGGRSNASAAQYAAAVHEIAAELSGTSKARIGVLDLFKELGPPAEMQADGLHLSAKGNARFADLARKSITTLVPEMAPDRLARHITPWRECLGLPPS